MHNRHYDAIVIGAGPAGLTAGIYLARGRMRTLIVDQGMAGGQLTLTHEIANYPGVETMSGYQLAAAMKRQAASFGCDFRTNAPVTGLQLHSDVKRLTLNNGEEYTADAVILAPGGKPRDLNVPGENLFKGKGISYCAACDGDFFTGKEIIVIGGGNSALEEAVSLTKYASKVTIIHQFDHFQAFDYAIEEARENEKIDFMMESKISAFYGAEKLGSVDATSLRTGAVRRFKTDGAFVFIGYMPNTEFLQGKVKMNENREILVDADMAASVPGVFAAGDCIAKKYRQATTAVGDGTIAALAATSYLHKMHRHLKLELTN